MKATSICNYILPLFVFLAGCEKNQPQPTTPDTPTPLLFGTGWDRHENYAQTIPVAINYGNYQSGDPLPISVDLTSHFPPIGDQGQLGTCVAWATGYNTKTYLDAAGQNLSTSQLQSPNNQYSPSDLFFSIDQSKRSCDHGTFFDDAFNLLITRGVNTLASVPYDGLCHSSSPGDPSLAAAHKIKNYRRIQGSVTEIKEYLAQGIPVVMGAMVNRQFQMWQGGGILNNLDYTGDEGGHAMVIAGYDDSKSAFRIVNSWGYTWGDNGLAWVGYDFLVNKLCVQGGEKSLFVAFNDNSTPIDPQTPTASSPDVTALVMSDYTLFPTLSLYSNARRAFFDVKNIGDQTIPASSGWNIYYLWVDAFNASNYGIIFRGEFTTTIPQNTFQNLNANYTLINFDLAPNALLGQTIAGLPYVSWDYFMPQLIGNYYLVMFIDKGNSNERNQTNNVFYVTQTPKFFNNGYSLKSGDASIGVNKHQFENLSSFKLILTKSDLSKETSLKPFRKLTNEAFKNGYTSEEIVSFLNHKIKNGGL